jgi:alpha-L-fucosidase 2
MFWPIKQFLICLAGAAVVSAIEPPAEPMSVWFNEPAKTFKESCPLGNGCLGAIDFGGTDEWRIVLNESSVWSGGPYDSNRHDAWKCLPEVREKIFAGEMAGAEALLKKNFQYPDGTKGWWNPKQFGCYQILGDLMIRFQTSGDAAASGYRRDLNLMQGVSTTTFTLDSAGQKREVFVSKPDEVIVVNPLFPFPDRLSSVFSALGEKANS